MAVSAKEKEEISAEPAGADAGMAMASTSHTRTGSKKGVGVDQGEDPTRGAKVAVRAVGAASGDPLHGQDITR